MSHAPVLLLGASGQVGLRLQRLLGDACMAVPRHRCDFSTLTLAQAQALIAEYQPAIIINAAAFTAVDAAQEQRALAMQVNGHAPGMLAVAAAAHDIAFVHLSTDYVFDGTYGPYREDDPCAPLNVYGESKWHGEQAIKAVGGRYFIFRLQWIYDKRGANFFLAMRSMLRERDSIRVVADQYGAPSSAGSVAGALVQAMHAIQHGTLAPGIYHLASAGHTSWHGFACAIAQAMGNAGVNKTISAITSAEYATAAPRPPDARLDCTALAAHGIVLAHWQDGLTQLMEEIDAHR